MPKYFVYLFVFLSQVMASQPIASQAIASQAIASQPMASQPMARQGNKFNHYVFTRLWDNKTHQFTIHGLWPNYRSQGYPSYCGNQPLHISKLTGIQDDLMERWPSHNGSNVDFWKHEWIKHGTCALGAPYIKNQLSYFASTLWLDMRLSNLNVEIQHYLQNSSFYNSNGDTPTIFSDFFKPYATVPYCVFSNKNQYLNEVRSNVDKTLQFIEPIYPEETGQCLSNEPIYL